MGASREGSRSERLPCSRVYRQVMIFVVLAMGSSVFSSFPKSMCCFFRPSKWRLLHKVPKVFPLSVNLWYDKETELIKETGIEQ